MSKYLIIDVSKNKKEQHLFSPLIRSLKNLGVILSEEETEAKLKEVFDEGHDYGFVVGYDGKTCNENEKQEDWNEVKKELLKL